MLLTTNMKDCVDLLTKHRASAGVNSANPYLFARPNGSDTSFYRGSYCLHESSLSCGAKQPQLLTSTRLRKHVATVSQILNLKNNELDQLAQFLGHNIRVHSEYYRQAEGVVQVAKISRILLAMEPGQLHQFQGKGLDEIEVNTDGESLGQVRSGSVRSVRSGLFRSCLVRSCQVGPVWSGQVS